MILLSTEKSMGSTTNCPKASEFPLLRASGIILGSCASPYNDVIMDLGKVYNPLKGSGRKEETLYGRPSVRDKRLRRCVERS